MKQRSFVLVMITVILSLANTTAFTSETGRTDPFTTSVYTALPSLPGLPLEDDFLCGDVNEDGFVNVLDIISMVNYIMGGDPSPFNQEAADINADNGINVLDIIGIVNIIMQVQGLPCTCVAPVSYEGQTYSTVQIGEQCWFQENLNVGLQINSTIPIGGQEQTDNGIIEKYCYDNDIANCTIYGGLYEWNESMQYINTEGAQGICPAGWHIPMDSEWKKLEGTVDSQHPLGDSEWDNIGWRGYDAGSNLKETGTTHWNSPNTGASNESGFTGLPGGHRLFYGGDFDELGNFGQFWSSSQYDANRSWFRALGYNSAFIYRNYKYNDDGLSIRCLKGCWPQPTQANAGPDQLNVPGTSATLAGNVPVNGTGIWAIVSGTGGTIVTPSNPTSEFQGLAGNEYSLSWTITTACGSSADTVVISFASAGFTCGTDLVDERDGQSYATVLIGDQCWMAENLNVGTKINSTAGGFLQTDNDTIEKYCYDNDSTNCELYGGLYEWPEAMQYGTTEGAQGICPDGWHIPAIGEWTILTDFLGGNVVAGGKMKSTGTLEDETGLWHAPNLGATNESGFTGLPGGYRRFDNGNFRFLGNFGYIWSSSLEFSDYALYIALFYNDFDVGQSSNNNFGLTIRCLRD